MRFELLQTHTCCTTGDACGLKLVQLHVLEARYWHYEIMPKLGSWFFCHACILLLDSEHSHSTHSLSVGEFFFIVK